MVGNKFELLPKEQLNLIRQRARNNFLDFCIAIDNEYVLNWHLELLEKSLMDIESGAFQKRGKKILIVQMPPRHSKSLTSTVYFPIWFLGKDPKREVITCSYSDDLATTFGDKARTKISSPQFKDIFPQIELREDAKSRTHWMTKEYGGYTSVGIGGALSGKGADLFIIDDPIKNKEEADSIVIREKHWGWFQTTAFTRLEPNGVLVLILTRWHLDDLAGRILSNPEYLKRTELISFPAIAEDDEKYRKKGEALWPFRFPIEELESIKASSDIINFQSIYQQNPLSGETQDFKQEYFSYFEEMELPERMNIDIVIDPAISQKKNACNTAIVPVGKALLDNPNWYILDVIAGKFNPLEIIDKTFDLVRNLKALYKEPNIRVYVEGVAYQESLKYYFEEKMKKDAFYFILDTFTDKQDKDQRIRGLVPLYKVGIIKHRKWMKDLESELLTFPAGKYKDRIDALASHLKIKQNTASSFPLKKKSWLEEEREKLNKSTKLQDDADTNFLNDL